MNDIYRKYKENDDLFISVIHSEEVFNHRDRMTVEGLHSKSDIAMELGYKDIQIARLKADYDLVVKTMAEKVTEQAAHIELVKECQERNYGNATQLHLDMITLAAQLKGESET